MCSNLLAPLAASGSLRLDIRLCPFCANGSCRQSRWYGPVRANGPRHKPLPLAIPTSTEAEVPSLNCPAPSPPADNSRRPTPRRSPSPSRLRIALVCRHPFSDKHRAQAWARHVENLASRMAILRSAAHAADLYGSLARRRAPAHAGRSTPQVCRMYEDSVPQAVGDVTEVVRGARAQVGGIVRY